MDLEETAAQVINALAEKDMARVADFVHPEMGVRFSPYGFVREEHQVFMPGELAGLVGSDQVYTWGAYDGSGDPIDLTFDDYYLEFVYSSDFTNLQENPRSFRVYWKSLSAHKGPQNNQFSFLFLPLLIIFALLEYHIHQ